MFECEFRQNRRATEKHVVYRRVLLSLKRYLSCMFNLPIESAVVLSHGMIWVMMVRDTNVVTESRLLSFQMSDLLCVAKPVVTGNSNKCGSALHKHCWSRYSQPEIYANTVRFLFSHTTPLVFQPKFASVQRSRRSSSSSRLQTPRFNSIFKTDPSPANKSGVLVLELHFG